MVLSPLSLWKNYDRKVMPLDITVIKENKEAEYLEQFVYFNGEASSNGCTRIFARFLTPQTPTDSVLVIMAEPHQTLESVDCTHILKNNISVLLLDYAGDAFGHNRFTIYPRSLAFSNYDESTLFAPTETPYQSCWYIWATVAMRGVTFCEEKGFSKIGLFGIGYGGAQMIKCAAACQGILGAATLYSPGFLPPEDDPALLAMRVGINTAAYAACLKAPVFMLCCSNDDDKSLDDISEFCAQSSGYATYFAEPRTSRGRTPRIESNLEYFFSKMFNGEIQAKLYQNVAIKAAGRENKVYFSLSQSSDNPMANQTEQTKPVKFDGGTLYFSQGVKNPTYRNWRAIPLQKAGEDEYFAYTEVFSEKLFCAYACLERNGFFISTPILKALPATLNVKAVKKEKKRLIYSSEMKIDDFFTSDQRVSPQIKEGPFGIEGIAANTLNTYKIGNEVYSGGANNTLQLLLYSPTAQEVTISVIDNDNYNTYSCIKKVCPENDWLKILVSAHDLKSLEGNLSGWDKALFLHIGAKEEVLVNSILWV